MGSTYDKNSNLNESGASFNMPEKKEREKSNFEEFILKLLGRIVLTKSTFFGLENKKIVIFVTPSLKIANVLADPKKLLRNFPLDRNSTLNFDLLTQWAKENSFEITFSSPTPKLKRILSSKLGDVMVESKTESKKEVNISILPESIQKWAKENPEKFSENIDRIKRLLK